MDNNHSWPSIQNYSLSEIGLFLKTIIRKEAHEKSERLSQNWISNHLKYEAIKELINEIQSSVEPPKTPEEEYQEIRNNWIRLKSLKQRKG